MQWNGKGCLLTGSALHPSNTMIYLRLAFLLALAIFVCNAASANKNAARLDRQWKAKRETCEKDVCSNGRYIQHIILTPRAYPSKLR